MPLFINYKKEQSQKAVFNMAHRQPIFHPQTTCVYSC